MGEKQKTEREKEREKRRDRTMVITMAKLRMAHASTHGALKPPGPKFIYSTCHRRIFVGSTFNFRSASILIFEGKQNFSLGSFPKVGQKQKTEKKERERERLNDGISNGQLRIANATSGGARKAAWAKSNNH